MFMRPLRCCWCVVLACCPWAAAQTTLEGSIQWEAVYKAGALAERHVQFASQFERALVFDNVTVETLLGFIQALEIPKTASSADERTFELNLEWDYELGTVHACWKQGDVRFPEAGSKDRGQRSLCLSADVDFDPLALKIAFEDVHERFPGASTKDREQRSTTFEGALNLGEVRLDERVQLRGIRFPLDAKKAETNGLFETRFNFPLQETAVALLRRDRIEGFPNDPKKDKHQTLLQVEARRVFTVWELEARWQQELEQFPLDPAKHKRISALELEGTLSSRALEMSATWAQERTAFERDSIKDNLIWSGEAAVGWSMGALALQASLKATLARFPNDPAKDQDNRIFNAEAVWEFDALGPFYPKRFSTEIQTRSTRLPANPQRDELRLEWACQLRLVLLKDIILDFTVTFEDQRFPHDAAKPTTSRSAFELEFAADF